MTRRKLSRTLGAVVLELMAELDVLVSQAVRGKTFAAIPALVHLKQSVRESLSHDRLSIAHEQRSIILFLRRLQSYLGHGGYGHWSALPYTLTISVRFLLEPTVLLDKFVRTK